MTRSVIVAYAILALAGSFASAGTFDIFGDAADYEIRMDTNTNALTADDGSDALLDVIADPSFDAQERRAIFQFDLSQLGTGLQSIDSAMITITLESVDVFPTQDVDLYGSNDNRMGALTEFDAGATDEYDAPSYELLATNFAPIANPTLTDIAYSADIGSFISDRYDDYLSDNGSSFIYFRIQTQALTGTSFYNFYSGDEGEMSFRPVITVEGTIPAPATLAVLLPAVLARRRRRS